MKHGERTGNSLEIPRWNLDGNLLGQVGDTLDNQVNDRVPRFEPSLGNPGMGSTGKGIELVPGVPVNHQVDDPCFILQGDKGDPAGRAGTLANQDQPGNTSFLVVGEPGELVGGSDTQLFQLIPAERDRMGLQGKPGGLVIDGNFFCGRHGGEGRCWYPGNRE